MYKKRFFIFLCFIALWGGGVLAQQRLLQQAFRFTGISSNEDMNALNTRFSNEGWTFSGSCYGMNNAYLQVGESDGTLGTVTTPAVPFNGRVQVVVRIYRIQGNSASYSIKTPTNNTITGTVPSENTSYPVTFIVENWTPESKIEISNSGSSYYVTNVDIYDIGNAYYYESFNYMTGKTSDAYSITDKSSDFSTLVYRCDNLGSSFTGSGSGLRQSTGAIYFSSDNNNSFVTPVFAAENALLSFKVLREETSTIKTFNFTVSGGDGVSLTPLNFTSSTNLSNSCTLNGLGSGLATYKILVSNINGKSLTFTGYHVHLDDIMLLPLSATTINEGSDNSARIAAYDGMTCNVMLTRTLKEGIWNTMCLPFDVTPGMFGSNANAELRTLKSSNEGDFVFNRVEEVEAGKPFLVKVSAEVKNPTFSGVTVENVQPQTVGDEGYKFCGTYSPINLNTDGTHVFLGTDAQFYKPSAGGNRMNGLRAYFIVPKPDGTTTNARIAIYDEPSAIHDLSTSAAPNHSGCYDLTGRRHDAKQLSTGLYIRDGRKFYVK